MAESYVLSKYLPYIYAVTLILFFEHQVGYVHFNWLNT